MELYSPKSSTLAERLPPFEGQRFPFHRGFYLFIFGFCTVFIFFHYWMGGLHPIHLIYTCLLLALVLIHYQTRLFFIAAIPIFIHNILYDSFRYIPFHWLLPIHIAEPYQLDQWLFGVPVGDKVLLFHQFLQQYYNGFLYVMAGLFYHIHEAMVFVFIFLLWKVKSLDLAFRFSITFLVMNLLSFATYLFYPAAAPWYVEQHGFIQPLAPIFGSAAGLTKFDHLLSIHFSEGLYQLNPVVFGAIPSMHAGFAALIWLFANQVGPILRWFFACYFFGMCFSALYLGHHYMVDLVIGVLYALIAYFIMEKIQRGRVQRLLYQLEGWVSGSRKV
jgi:inositol phosphorylceramide synthase catalytic subunit